LDDGSLTGVQLTIVNHSAAATAAAAVAAHEFHRSPYFLRVETGNFIQFLSLFYKDPIVRVLQYIVDYMRINVTVGEHYSSLFCL